MCVLNAYIWHVAIDMFFAWKHAIFPAKFSHVMQDQSSRSNVVIAHQICYCYPRYTSSLKRSICLFVPWVFVTWNIWDTSLLYQSICPNSVGRGNVTDTHPAREIRTPHRICKTRSSLSLLISDVKITWTDIIHLLGVISTANAFVHHHHHHHHQHQHQHQHQQHCWHH